MAAEIAASEEFLKVVRQTYSVKLDDTSLELLNSAWMYVPVDVVLLVQELKSCHDLLEHLKRLIVSHVLLAESFPLAYGVWGLHLNEE